MVDYIVLVHKTDESSNPISDVFRQLQGTNRWDKFLLYYRYVQNNATLIRRINPLFIQNVQHI